MSAVRFLLPLLPLTTAFTPLLRPAIRAASPRTTHSPVMMTPVDHRVYLEITDPRIVGTLELLLLSGVIASYEIARTMQVHMKTGIYFGHEARRARNSLRTVPQMAQAERMWLAGAVLPPLEELAQSCFHIADAQHASGRAWFLCASPQSGCEPDEDFSAYYGQPVYVCEM